MKAENFLVNGKGYQLTSSPNQIHRTTVKIGISATEPSGDILGAELITALNQRSDIQIEFHGIGGDAMKSAGLTSLYDIKQLAVMGPVDFIAAIPTGYKLAKRLVRYLSDKDLDVMIIIDSPEFNHPVARWLRAKTTNLTIFNLVAPTVWAWRPWRARKMKPYINEVLAVLPFEPAVFQKLGGPACTFIGHPAIDRARRNTMTGMEFRKKYKIPDDKSILVMLPGSRKGEIRRHMAIFTKTVNSFAKFVGPVQTVMPIVAHMKHEISSQLQKHPLDVVLVEDEQDKWGAFRAADLALASSGTVTLELTATHTPMVVAYRVDRLAPLLKWLINAHSVVLPNLIMQENIIPEFIHKECVPETLAPALIELYQSADIRNKQRLFLKKVTDAMDNASQPETAQRAAIAIINRLKSEHREI